MGSRWQKRGAGWRVFCTVLALALLASPVARAQQATVKDVPPNHWAYQAVVKLVNEGYLEVYQDGSFRGDRPVDRYTLARVVARLLDEMSRDTGRVTEEDVQLLRKLSTEFRSELVQLASSEEDVRNRLKAVSDRLGAVSGDVADLNKRVGRIAQEGASRQQTLQALEARVAELEKALGGFKQEQAESDQRLAQQLESVRAAVGLLQKELQGDLQEVSTRTQELAQQQDTLARRLEAVAAENARLNAQLGEDGWVRRSISGLEQQLASMREQFNDDVARQIAASFNLAQDLDRRVTALESRLAQEEEEKKKSVSGGWWLLGLVALGIIIAVSD